jgi:hypothetical protein
LDRCELRSGCDNSLYRSMGCSRKRGNVLADYSRKVRENITKESRIAQIKREAAERINEILPAWKQSNLNARANELNAIRFFRELTESEHGEWQEMMLVWQAVKQIRIDSNAAENVVKALDTVEEIEAFSW